MKAVVFDEYGPPEVLRVAEVPPPEPRAGEVLVQVHAAGVNDWDWQMLLGIPFVNRAMNGLRRPRKIPILGCDVAGTVVAAGAGAPRFRPGDAVYGDLSSDGFGGFAELVRAPEKSLAPMPAGMSFVDAAALPQPAMLAIQALRAAGTLKAGQTLLVNGAGGGVGTLAAQIARGWGVEATGIDSADKFEIMRAAGFAHVIDYRSEDFTAGEARYDLVIDNKLTRSLARSLRVLRPGGIYAVNGGDTGKIMQVFFGGGLLRALTGKTIRVVMLEPNRDLDFVSEEYTAGRLRPVVDRVYPLEGTMEAFRYYGSGQHKGKVVIRVRDEAAADASAR